MSQHANRPPTIIPPGGVESVEREFIAVHEFLAVSLADEVYAFPLHAVREILKVLPITRVPRAPHSVVGIISVRGRITTVVDLRLRLGQPSRPTDHNTRVLLLDAGEEVIGVLVDSVSQVYRLDGDEIELSEELGGELSEHVVGIGRPRAERDIDTILILLDPAPLLRMQ